VSIEVVAIHFGVSAMTGGLILRGNCANTKAGIKKEAATKSLIFIYRP